MTNTDIIKAARDYKELQAMIKELEAEADVIKAAITAELDAQGVDILQADIFTIKHTAYSSSRVDTTALKNELPDVAARYTKTTEVRRSQIA